ncbi:hypothetical protein BRADI_4g06611v3 [Brachypodium distachyon]|uniref:NB-ARC domain-containing protein n=1 Tax=Brachypodium distachyon TaxID=15368 RepID=A0A2K2CKW2_BRADI|nr:hypothetical protein BRADI_4g06611v3 [Brachypodium distachyon]
MNAILRMHSEADDGGGDVDHFVREWTKQVRELAYDAEDCVDLYVFRIRCPRRGAGVLVRSRRILATLFSRRALAGDINGLCARAVAISERHARYGVNREALRRAPFFAPVSGLAESARALRRRAANGHDEFVGIRGQANTLAGKVGAVGTDKRLKVFSIVGFGGLGKTTLAMEVCRQLERAFQRLALVSVSQAFDGRKEDVEGLLKRVLRQIVKVKTNEEGIRTEEHDLVSEVDTMDLDGLAHTVEELLGNKRYLIVIDDVWTVAAWDAIVSRLPENTCDSRIIVTTRIETVAKACCSDVGGDYLYPLKPLNSEDSKELFLSRAFGSKDAYCPQELQGEMDTILRKCGGLPLAIVSIASLLTSYGSKDMWERVCRSIGSHMESHPTLEGMRQILTLSYNHLPHHLKGCMMYLSIFPEDYVIHIGRLLHRWIAEGLVEEKRGLTSLEVAEAYLDELMSRSMIDAVTSTGQDQRALECRVHDMMLEVMVSKSLEANFASLLGRQYEGITYDRIRRLSIHGGEHGSMAAGQMNMQHARSLSTFNLEGHKLLDRLGEFSLLTVLDLQDCKGLQNKHMRDVCRMYLLRYLSVKNTHITLLPPKVGELEHLQTLDAMHTGLEGLPDTVTKLKKLERLLFTNRNDYRVWWLPSRGLSKMKALRELVRIGIKDVQVAREIGELQQMRVICIYIDLMKTLSASFAAP